MIFLLLAFKWPKILVLAVTPTPHQGSHLEMF